MYGVLYHSPSPQIVLKAYGTKLRIKFAPNQGVVLRVLFADQLFADIGIVFGFDDPANRLPTADAVVGENQPVEFRPILGDPPHGYQRIDPLPEMPGKIIPECKTPQLRQFVVADERAFRRRGRGQRYAVDIKFLLGYQAVHERYDPIQLPAVVAERVDDSRVVRPERHEIFIAHDRVFVDHFDLVSGQGVDEREHRRNGIFDRIRRRQPVAAAVERLHPSVERHEKLFAAVLGSYVLRIEVRNVFFVTNNRIQPRVGRIRELYQLPVGPPDLFVPEGRIGMER